MIHVAGITDEALEQLVGEYRDKAGQAERTVTARTPQARKEAAAHYRATQNALADIYQELLDRRRAAEPITQQ